MISPRSEAELADTIRGGQSFRVTGGGTRGFGDHVAANSVLSTRAMTGITLFEPGALTLVARAGTPLDEIETALDAEGQMLAFEPMDHRALLKTKGKPTIGGTVAANVSGPRRIQAGAARDALLGVRFVNGSGEVIKNGGRVMKNVTGYDLVKLMAGSYGTLGVLSEVSFKVLPKPQSVGTCVIEGLDDLTAVAAMAAALGSPFDVTGAAHLKRGLTGAPATLIRVEGFVDQVSYRTKKLKDLLSLFGDVSIEDDPEACGDIWEQVRDVKGFADEAGDIWRVSVKPSDGPRVVENVGPLDASYDWGGGLVWMRTTPGTDVRGLMGKISGHATQLRGATGKDVFQPEPFPVAKLTNGIREKFDPQGKLNPGLMR